MFGWQPTLAGEDHTRAVFRDVMTRLIAASGEDPPFRSVTGKKTAADRSGDTRYALTVFVPIFASCEVRDDWHVPTAVWCQTNPNEDAKTVRTRFDQVVADLRLVLKDPNLKVGDCAAAGGLNGERCLAGSIPVGMLDLALLSDSKRHKYLLMRMGNY